MNAARHTPGPWTTAELSPLDVVAAGDKLAMIAMAREGMNGIDRAEAAANARLIAAAPALAELLREALPFVAMHSADHTQAARIRAALAQLEAQQ